MKTRTMENFFAVFKDHPSPFIVIFLGLLSVSFILLRRKYLLKYMKPRHLCSSFNTFSCIEHRLSIISRNIHEVVYKKKGCSERTALFFILPSTLLPVRGW